jgi:hypothetical protein
MFPPFTVALLPKAGLGNKLYVWAKGLVFAHINQTRFLSSNWTQLSLGTFLRGEKSKRIYFNQFKTPYFPSFLQCQYNRLLFKQIIDPVFYQSFDVSTLQDRSVFIFKDLNKDLKPDDSFRNLSPFRSYIKEQLLASLTPRIHSILSRASSPMIGVHIRRGDFQYTPWLTSLDYFIHRIHQIREIAGQCLPVTVFSNGQASELSAILDLPNVKLAVPNPEIIDLLLLSRSQILVTSPVSTFSNWSAFLSDQIVIRDYLFPHQPARDNERENLPFEGIPPKSISEWPDELAHQISLKFRENQDQ